MVKVLPRGNAWLGSLGTAGAAAALTWVLCILMQKLNKARADEYLCGLLLDDSRQMFVIAET